MADVAKSRQLSETVGLRSDSTDSSAKPLSDIGLDARSQDQLSPKDELIRALAR
jgi:hypothetical protein